MVSFILDNVIRCSYGLIFSLNKNSNVAIQTENEQYIIISDSIKKISEESPKILRLALFSIQWE